MVIRCFKISRDLLIYHELIGLRVEILSHSDPKMIGRSGRVIDETANTLVIVDDRKQQSVRIPKLYGVFAFYLPSGEKVVVDGTLIHGRPEDRLKRMHR